MHIDEDEIGYHEDDMLMRMTVVRIRIDTHILDCIMTDRL